MARTRMKSNRRPQSQQHATPRYNQRMLMHDRQYGFYWYAWLWKLLRPVLILLISLIVVAGITITGWNYVYGHFFMPVDPDNRNMQEFVIESGTSVSSIGANLLEQGYIRNSGVFKYIVQFQELTGKIQAGSYTISPSMDVNEIISILARGVADNERQITIIPGWTIDDIANYLFKQGAITSVQEFQALCNDPGAFSDNFVLFDDLIKAKAFSGRKYALEGYLAPDTYRVYKSATPEAILLRLLKQSEDVYDAVFNQEPTFETTIDEDGNELDEDGNIVTEQPELYTSQLTRDQTIILASLIEKEAGRTQDYRKVSAVFHNRLEKGMKLESDASISYALGISRLVLTSAELQTQSPYNTYLSDGLPSGPICTPSQKALTAALYPDSNFMYDEYLYFCAGDPAKGNLVFSKTKEEHEAAVAQYRPLWVEYDQSHAN